MKLRELEAEFIRCEEGGRIWSPIADIQAADGVMFLCPTCYANNNGKVGTHAIVCWKPRIPWNPETKELAPGPGRWEMQGSGLDDLTLVAGSSSIKLDSPCNAHFFVRNGEIVQC